MPGKPKQTPHLRIRIELGLLGRLEKAREKSGRTLTGEIVHRLEQSFRKDDLQDMAEATASAVVKRVRPSFTLLKDWSPRPWLSLEPSAVAARAAMLRDAEDAAVKLVTEQNPSTDEHAAREYVNKLVEKWALQPRTETPEERRHRGLYITLRFLEGTLRSPELLAVVDEGIDKEQPSATMTTTASIARSGLFGGPNEPPEDDKDK
jgi:hypothetical protein